MINLRFDALISAHINEKYQNNELSKNNLMNFWFALKTSDKDLLRYFVHDLDTELISSMFKNQNIPDNMNKILDNHYNQKSGHTGFSVYWTVLNFHKILEEFNAKDNITF